MDRMYMARNECDSNLLPKYILSTANGTWISYESALKEALKYAAQDLASQILVEVTGTIDKSGSFYK